MPLAKRVIQSKEKMEPCEGHYYMVNIELCGTPIYRLLPESSSVLDMVTCDGFFTLTDRGAIDLAKQLLQAVLEGGDK